MIWFFAILVVLALGGIAVVAAGRGRPDGRGVRRPPRRAVPADGPLTADDLRRVRFSLAFRGYRMSEVDALLDRLAARAGGEAAEPAADGADRRRRRVVATDRRGLGHTAPVSHRGDRLHPHRAGGGGRRADPAAARAASGGAGRLQVGHGAGQRPHRRRRARPGRPGWSSWSPTRRRARRRAGRASSRWRSGGSTAVAGLLILVRWLPSRGKHAAEAREDTWSEGPGLSILAHVGMLVGVLRLHLRLPHLARCDRSLGARPWRALLAAAAAGRRAAVADGGRGPGAAGLAHGGRRRRDAVVGRRKLGRVGPRPADHGLPAGRARQAEGRADLDHARRRAGAPGRSCSSLQGRAADPRASTCGWCRRTTPTGWPAAPARTPAASTSTATSPTAGPTSTAATSPGRGRGRSRRRGR